jgi:hypothetical protein
MTTLTLRKLSSFVYDLPVDYQNIIKFLALHGSGNLTNISEFTKNSEKKSRLDRWAVKKRIYGSSRFQGLIDRDYLIEKLENKHRYRKQERTFYLTSKGILASLATVPLKNNISFRNIFDFGNRVTKVKKQSRFIEEFIISQTKYFLSYLYLQGIQLTWQRNTWRIYYDFLKDAETGLDIEINNKEIMSEFRKLFDDYVILRSVYHYLGGRTSDKFQSSISLWEYLDDFDLPTIQPIKKLWEQFVYHWFISPQPQIPESEEFRRMIPSNIPNFETEGYIFSKKDDLKKLLIKKLKTIN